MAGRQGPIADVFAWPPNANPEQAKEILFDDIRRVEKLSRYPISKRVDAVEDDERNTISPQATQQDDVTVVTKAMRDETREKAQSSQSRTEHSKPTPLAPPDRISESVRSKILSTDIEPRGVHKSAIQMALGSGWSQVPSNKRSNSDGVLGLSPSASDVSDNKTTIAGRDRTYPPLSDAVIRMSAIPKTTAKRPSTGKQKQTKPPQLFRNLVFYFYPNNTHAKPRQLRIEKAIEYGAMWHPNWSHHVTHIITDAVVTYSDLTRHIPTDLALRPDLVIVNEQYPADCISNRWLLDPVARRYNIIGAPLTKPDEPAAHNLKRSAESSLVLKPSKRQMTASQSTVASNSEAKDMPNQLTSHDSADRIPATAIPAAQRATSAARSEDELSTAINEAKNSTAVGFMDDDEDREQMDNDARNYELRNRILGRKTGLQLALASDASGPFRCQNKYDGTEKQIVNPNARTIEVLRQMGSIYERMQDHWRALAYRKVINTLEKTTEYIETAEQARKINTIGPRLALKIEEIATTNQLQRLENALDDPRDKAIIEFTRIYGVGVKKASAWVEAGLKTFDDLKKYIRLTPNQIIGIEHADDFEQRIPRAEIEEHYAQIKKLTATLDPDIEITVMGSYRRGAKDSGDVDLIFTKPHASTEYLRDMVLHKLIATGTKDGYIKATLTDTSRKDSTKWHGACSLGGSNGVWRRVDFLIVPWKERGAALLYFTGNDIFNRSIRLLASKKGMRLNQMGLYKDVMRGPGRVKMTEGELLESESERKIFEILGVGWREPEERNC